MSFGAKISGWSLKSNELWKININQKFGPFRYFLECIHYYLENFVYFAKLEFKRDTLNSSEIFAELKKQPLNLSGSCFLSYIGSIGIILDHRIKVIKSWWSLELILPHTFISIFSQLVPSTSKWLWFFVTKKISGNFLTQFQFFVILNLE